SRCWFQSQPEKRYAKLIKDFVRQESIDAVICFAYPFSFARSVLAADLGTVKKIYYQFDPYGLHLLLDQASKAQRIQEEIEVISNSDFTFTTHEMLRGYSQNANYIPFLSKIKAESFPL